MPGSGDAGMRGWTSGDRGTVATPSRREFCAHRIQAGRLPEARQRRREAARCKNAAQDTLGGAGGGAPGARGYRGPPLSGPLSAGGITRSSVFISAPLPSWRPCPPRRDTSPFCFISMKNRRAAVATPATTARHSFPKPAYGRKPGHARQGVTPVRSPGSPCSRCPPASCLLP